MHAVHRDRGGCLCDVEGAAGLKLHLLWHELLGRLADKNGAGRRQCPQPGGEVHGLPHRRVESLRLTAEAADHHQAGVHPAAELEGTGSPTVTLLRALSEVQGGQHRPPGVILMRHGRAKQRQQAVCRELRDGPLVLLHDRLGGREEPLHQAMHRLRPHTRREHHCLGHAAAEHGHGFVLRFELGGGAGRRRPRTALLLQRLGSDWFEWPVAVHAVLVAHFGGGHEAIAPAMQGMDHPLRSPGIANGLAHGFDTGVQRRVRDELVGPQLLE